MNIPKEKLKFNPNIEFEDAWPQKILESNPLAAFHLYHLIYLLICRFQIGIAGHQKIHLEIPVYHKTMDPILKYMPYSNSTIYPKKKRAIPQKESNVIDTNIASAKKKKRQRGCKEFSFVEKWETKTTWKLDLSEAKEFLSMFENLKGKTDIVVVQHSTEKSKHFYLDEQQLENIFYQKDIGIMQESFDQVINQFVNYFGNGNMLMKRVVLQPLCRYVNSDKIDVKEPTMLELTYFHKPNSILGMGKFRISFWYSTFYRGMLQGGTPSPKLNIIRSKKRKGRSNEIKENKKAEERRFVQSIQRGKEEISKISGNSNSFWVNIFPDPNMDTN